MIRLLCLSLSALLFAQQPQQIPPAALQQESPNEAGEQVDFICPMDKDVRTKGPGKCPRCGMKLVAGIADPTEYPVNLKLKPKVARPGVPVEMEFTVENPADHSLVKKFEIVHEKLFHLFLVSEDLSYFAHEHPDYEPSGTFRFKTALPLAGAYRVVTDFYPAGGTPQMNSTTLFVAGKPVPPKALVADTAPQKGANLEVSLTMEPAQPLAGFKTMMFFTLKPAAGKLALQQYLGAWGHMLAASEDLIDLVHTHPFIADGSEKIQFNVYFPRAGMHRVWVQFQNNGEVNTVAFTVPVKNLQ